MFEAIRMRMRSVAMLAVAGALVVAGVAAAQGGDSGSGTATKTEREGKPNGHPPGPPPMVFGGPMQGLTNGVLHVRNGKDEAETIRLDQGEITALGDDSITLEENDGSSVTVAVDDGTAVMAPGEKPAVGEKPEKGEKPDPGSLDDLEVGDEVTTSGPEGDAADSVAVVPSKADLPAPPAGAPGPMAGPSLEMHGSSLGESRSSGGSSSGGSSE